MLFVFPLNCGRWRIGGRPIEIIYIIWHDWLVAWQ